MVLFDQQPMGPVPARRPVLIGQDPETAAAGTDLASADVEVLAPIPRELATRTTSKPRTHRLRVAVGVLLLLPLIPSLFGGLYALGWSESADPALRIPLLLAIGIVVTVIGCAHLVFRRSAGRGR